MSLPGVLGTAVLPTAAIAGVGFLLGVVRDIDAGALTTVTVYVLAPALVFHSLATTDLAASTLATVAAGVVVFTLVMMALSGGVGYLVGEREPVLGALVLVSAYPNSGNYGIPVSEFAFGATGRATAVAYLAAQSVVIYTLGIYVAARGSESSPLAGVRTVLSVPLVYAAVGAVGLRATGLAPPADGPAMGTVKLVGDAAIPVMLLILGIELAGTDYAAALGRVSPAAVLKLVVAPVVGIAVALALEFASPTVARVFVLECAMPAAVTPLILAGEFAGPGEDLSPAEYASTAILVTTVVSIPLLTGLIVLLRSSAPV